MLSSIKSLFYHMPIMLNPKACLNWIPPKGTDIIPLPLLDFSFSTYYLNLDIKTSATTIFYNVSVIYVCHWI